MGQQFDPILYFISAMLQLAAMVYCIRVLRDVNDRKPWLILFSALLIMFGARVIGLVVPANIRVHLGPWLSIPISLLLFLALFSIRRVAAAERESNAAAERSRAQRDESENRYHSLVELSPDVIFVNAGGKIAYANAAALKFFGAKNTSEILGRSPTDLVAEQSRGVVQGRIQQAYHEKTPLPLCVEYWRRLDGTIVPVEAAAALVPWQGGHAIQVILRDISEREKTEKEKSRLLASERSARSAAEHASRMKDEFLATLSHELRTPLNAILGWSQLLRQGKPGDDDMTEGLDVIERNARVQTQLIEDLLDMSRIISGKLRLDVQRVDPIVFIRAAIATVTPAAQAKGIRLENVLDPVAGPISGDPGRLQQVIWNLLSNAIKFTARNGKVQVILARVNSHIEITVSDSGQGILPEFLPYVFDRFRQADASTTRAHGGLGIGLAIVKQLVDLHGGQVQVRSGGQSQGASFTVNLPVVAVHVHSDNGERLHPSSPGAAALNCAGPDLRGIKVLVLDDEADARNLVKRVLEDCNAEVMTAANAEMASGILGQHNPDVIVSDIGMPDVDGFEFLRLTRARGYKTPAIALTAFARSEDRTRALMAGYQVHISKPVEPSELVATVASVVGRAGTLVDTK